MNTIKYAVFFLLTGAVLAGCNQVSYRKTPGGMPYKLFKGNGGKAIHVGDYVKVNATTTIKDSMVFSSAGKPPLYLRINESVLPYDISELWTKLKQGDSVETTQVMDTFIKRNPQNVPPQYKNGDRITTTLKIIDVFTSDSAARADDIKTKKEWLAGEVTTVGKYLAGKNITAQKTPSGAYVQITKPGTGNLIDSGKYISVKYRGATFSGTVFDTNMDTTFHHTEDYSFEAGSGRMIKGFDEGMLLLKNGSSARIYIPSLLGYGASPGTPLIKPYENLVFDVTITNVQDKAPAPPTPAVPKKVDMPQPKKK